MLAAVDVGALLEVIWVSVLAGVGVSLTFSLVVLGSARSLTARREGHDGAATAYAAMAVVAFGVFIAGLVFGVNIMLSK